MQDFGFPEQPPDGSNVRPYVSGGSDEGGDSRGKTPQDGRTGGREQRESRDGVRRSHEELGRVLKRRDPWRAETSPARTRR